MTSGTLRLWLALTLPSLFVVHRYGGWAVSVAYLVVAWVAVEALSRLNWPTAARPTAMLAAATLLVVIVLFAAIYPRVNSQVPGTGSDDDEAYAIGAHALLAGRSPYDDRTYLGNVLHQLPGAFVLAAPFVLAGSSALQNLFWIPLLFVVIWKATRDGGLALRLAWVTLACAPVVLHQIVTGTGQLSNAVWAWLILWWLTRTRCVVLVAVLWGLALASRANFCLLLPVAFVWLRSHRGMRVATEVTVVALAVVIAISLPFYLHNPRAFGPLEAADRLTRFDFWLPGSGRFIAVCTAAAAVAVCFGRLTFRNLAWRCAFVQAVPVILGVAVPMVSAGYLDLSFAVYGVFALPFALTGSALDLSAARRAN